MNWTGILALKNVNAAYVTEGQELNELIALEGLIQTASGLKYDQIQINF